MSAPGAQGASIRQVSQGPETVDFEFVHPAPNTIQETSPQPEVAPAAYTEPPTSAVAPTSQEQPHHLTGFAAESEDGMTNNSETSLAVSTLKLTLLCTTGTRVMLSLDKQFIEEHSLPVKEAESINVGQFKKLIYSAFANGLKQAEMDGAESNNNNNNNDTTNATDASSPANNNNNQNWGAVLAKNLTPAPIDADHIRLIHLGKVLVDTYTLEEYKITSANAFNVLHLSVKPENTGKEKSRKSRVKSGLTGGGSNNNNNNNSNNNNGANTAGSNGARNNQSGSRRNSNGPGDAGSNEPNARSGCCIIS